ncbi:MAG: asparagine synthase-related protein [Candidatus Hydrothermarchaeota archaeon]
MKVGLLYSGGMDSSFSALILSSLGYEVKLITINFGLLDSWKAARRSARALGFSHEVKRLNNDILKKCASIMIEDGFPNNGLNYIHKQAILSLCEDFSCIADGIKREDRAPKLPHDEIQSMEMKCGFRYIQPLLGWNSREIRHFCRNLFIVEEGESEKILKSDYEAEIREFIKQEYGIGFVKKIFPDHKQSHVIGWRNSSGKKYFLRQKTQTFKGI